MRAAIEELAERDNRTMSAWIELAEAWRCSEKGASFAAKDENDPSASTLSKARFVLAHAPDLFVSLIDRLDERSAPSYAQGMAPPKGTHIGGRARGTPNKRIVEQRLQAERAAAEAKASGKPLAKERLGEFLELFIGYARFYQPVLPQMLARGAKPNKNQDEAKFEKWSMHAIDAARELAKYQSPQFRAVAVVAQDNRERRDSTTAREQLRKLVIDTIVSSDEPDEVDAVGVLIKAPTDGKPN